MLSAFIENILCGEGLAPKYQLIMIWFCAFTLVLSGAFSYFSKEGIISTTEHGIE